MQQWNAWTRPFWGAVAAEPQLPTKLESLRDAATSYRWQDAAWSLGVIALAVIGGRLVAWIFFRGFGRWAKRTETTIDDTVTRHLTRPLRWLVPFVLLTMAMPLLVLPVQWRDGVHHFTLVASIVCSGWAVTQVVRIVDEVIKSRLELDDDDNLSARALATQTQGLSNIAVFVVVIVTIGVALMTFDRVRQVGSTLLASAGVAGLVLGFAAQRSLATILAGIQIAITQPFRVDDVVIVEGEWGRIEEITLTYVVVCIWDKRRLVVPINHFIEKPFQNWTRVSSDLLGTVELHLDYHVPVDAIRDELERILEASDHWDGEVASVQVTASSERTMTVRPLFSASDSSEQWSLRCEVREKLIAFVRERYPYALPRLRGEIDRGRADVDAA